MSDPAEDPKPGGGTKTKLSHATALRDALPEAHHVHVDALLEEIRNLEDALGKLQDKLDAKG